jgi:hypothetical protein
MGDAGLTGRKANPKYVLFFSVAFFLFFFLKYFLVIYRRCISHKNITNYVDINLFWRIKNKKKRY